MVEFELFCVRPGHWQSSSIVRTRPRELETRARSQHPSQEPEARVRVRLGIRVGAKAGAGPEQGRS